MSGGAQWLFELGDPLKGFPVDGLVTVSGYARTGRPPEEVVMMEKAEACGAHAVFFEAGRNDRPQVAQAFVFVDQGPANNPEFGKKHQKLWSWGGVPLLYRKTRGLVQLFRCAHKPDFFSKTEEKKCKPIKTLEIAGTISQKLSEAPWWDATQLRNGTLWDDPAVCKEFLNPDQAAHKHLFDAVKRLDAALDQQNILEKPLRQKLLILSLLIAYLEARGVFPSDYFGKFQKGATKFFEVLANGEALVTLLADLEDRFNGHVFVLADADRKTLKISEQLVRFAHLIEGREGAGGQLHLWQLYSFGDLPVELISHIYQLFVEDPSSSVYTPPFLVRLMLDEALSWERLDRLQRNNEIILDPCCGSGVFLVEAYKRLVLHWRSRHGWEKPCQDVLKDLLEKVHGIDLDRGATELTAFSLCLALCDALEPKALRESIKLFPQLVDKTLHHSCFFKAKEAGLVSAPIGVVVGNPPFKSKLSTPGAEKSYARYEKEHGSLADKQLAYLFLHEAMEMIAEGGVLSMLQQYNFLYNQQSLGFRQYFIKRWDVREILDFISVRGLFTKDTKVVVVVAVAAQPSTDRQILHATFRRSGRAEAKQGFDIDYYDLHWLSRQIALNNAEVWRTNLLGGGRALSFANRMKTYRTIREYADAQQWHYGEGFFYGEPNRARPASHVVGKAFISAKALSENGIERGAITKVPNRPIERPRRNELYSSPLLLVRKQMDLAHALWNDDSDLTFDSEVLGISAKKNELTSLSELDSWITSQHRALKAYTAATSVRLFTRKSTSLSDIDILSLPFPVDRALDLSPNEEIVITDIVDYYRDLIRLGEDSTAMKESGHEALSAFTSVYTQQINAIYKESPLQAREPQTWPGIICQPFVFGKGEVDWRGADELKDKLDAILHERHGSSLHVTRIARIYDGPFVFLLKPDRLRYWLRSVALRDADETLADLRSQGF